jgi:hypothetical protein
MGDGGAGGSAKMYVKLGTRPCMESAISYGHWGRKKTELTLAMDNSCSQPLQMSDTSIEDSEGTMSGWR